MPNFVPLQITSWLLAMYILSLVLVKAILPFILEVLADVQQSLGRLPGALVIALIFVAAARYGGKSDSTRGRKA